jgi:hypothetical protein
VKNTNFIFNYSLNIINLKYLLCLIYYLSVNFLNAQKTEPFKNTCHVFDSNIELFETGFVNLNDSIILSNYNDSVSVINLKKCKVIKRLNFRIHSNFNSDPFYEHQVPVVPILRDGNKIWLRLVFSDKSIWFGYLKPDMSFVKMCQINSPVFLFIKRGTVFYACVQDGYFVNNGSLVKTQISSGLISFNESGYLLNSKRVNNYANINFGESLRPIIFPVLLSDNNNIFLGTSVNSMNNPANISNNIYFGSQKINCFIGGNQSLPYIILKMDTAFNLKNQFIFEGTARNILQTTDSIIIFGTGGKVFIKGFGSIQSSVGSDYHYRLSIDKTKMTDWQICTISGSGGSGGWYDPVYFPGNYYQSETNFNYITFNGTIYFDKPYTSGGGQNIIFGYNLNNNCGDLSSILQINSQTNIWANLALGKNMNFISISKSSDFWIGNNRINRGKGIYYFAINSDGQVDLAKINGSLNDRIIEDNISFKIGPNPCSGILNIYSKDQIGRINIRDLAGNLIGEHVLNLSGLIDLTELNPGMYFIEFESGYKKAVIINKM